MRIIIGIGMFAVLGFSAFLLAEKYNIPLTSKNRELTLVIDEKPESPGIQPEAKQSYEEITWWDLLSEEEVQFYSEEIKRYEEDPQYISELTPPVANINPAIAGLAVRIPGFAVGVDTVPGEYNKTETFLFVPYQGACIHVPPPPPNQTVYVEMDSPVETDPYFPVYLTGIITIEGGDNGTAAYSYKIEGHKITPYEG